MMPQPPPSRCPSRIFRAAMLMMSMLTSLPLAAELQVRNHQWGFDGTVQSERFVPLYIELFNSGPDPFEGELELQRREYGSNDRRGAVLSEPIYLTPNTSRTVTFYPMVLDTHQEWHLRWGRRKTEQFDVPNPDLNNQTVVYLTNPTSIEGPPPGLRSLRWDRMPDTVGAMDSLGALVVDAVPNWQPAQEQAVLDWLRSGGQIHLLDGDAGDRRPIFSGALSVLNLPMPQFRIGAGRVFRHAVSRRGFSSGLVSRFLPPKENESELEDAATGGRTTGDALNNAPRRKYFEWPVLANAMGALDSLIRPRHNWALMYFATFLFLLIVGPLNLLLSRIGKVSYRGSITIILTSVAVFSYGFFFVGSRGYGESAVVKKIAVARDLGQGRYDVLQYGSSFVDSGDVYEIRHDGELNLYATGAEMEAVPGTIRFDDRGSFQVRIPVYSFRGFTHRAVMKGPQIDVTLENLQPVRIRTGENFPQDVREIYFVRGDQVHTLSRDPNGGWVAIHGQRYGDFVNIAHQTSQQQYIIYQNNYYYNAQYFDDPSVDPSRGGRMPTPIDRAENLVTTLIARDLQITDRVTGPLTAEDEGWLYVLAEGAPKEWNIRGGVLGEETAAVLYRFHLTHKPEQEAQDE